MLTYTSASHFSAVKAVHKSATKALFAYSKLLLVIVRIARSL